MAQILWPVFSKAVAFISAHYDISWPTGSWQKEEHFKIQYNATIKSQRFTNYICESYNFQFLFTVTNFWGPKLQHLLFSALYYKTLRLFCFFYLSNSICLTTNDSVINICCCLLLPQRVFSLRQNIYIYSRDAVDTDIRNDLNSGHCFLLNHIMFRLNMIVICTLAIEQLCDWLPAGGTEVCPHWPEKGNIR